MEYLNAIKDFIKPELIILIPVLYFVGVAIRSSKKIKNEYIPAVLGLIGVLLSMLYVVATCELVDYRSLLLALFTALTQGVLLAGTSVYADQFIKQKKYLKEDKSTTEENTDSAEVK